MLRKSLLGLSLTLGLFGCMSRSYNNNADGQNITSPLDFSGPKLQYDSYEVLFTNPECQEYLYEQTVKSNSGNVLKGKPKNVFCTRFDSKTSGSRPNAPQNRLIEWIQDPSTKEIFFTYLSFSNSAVTKALCEAVEKRGVKIKFVIDSSSNTAKADELKACKPLSGNAADAPEYFLRGHTPGIGYAHNKIFIVNPKSEKLGIVYSSGNMSSGIVLHHENWHFVKVSAKTYFGKSHLCAMDAELNAYQSADVYMKSISDCRKNSGYKEEGDIKVFFVPGDGDNPYNGPKKQTELAGRSLEAGVSAAKDISIAAHRFSYWRLKNVLNKRLSQSQKPSVRIMVDDDTWWAGKGNQTGDNTADEQANIEALELKGAQPRYMETNHSEHLLHHNKYVIMNMPNPADSAVFTGAGNLTGSAFRENWENFYYIRIPEVVQAFNKQYDMLYGMATKKEDLPSQDVMPKLPTP